jgi:hypothetical protein
MAGDPQILKTPQTEKQCKQCEEKERKEKSRNMRFALTLLSCVDFGVAQWALQSGARS